MGTSSNQGFTPHVVGGLCLIAAGAVLTVAPTLVVDPGPAADLFATIERRIPWGALAGLGGFIAAWKSGRPRLVVVAGLVFWLTMGALGARLVGLLLDGAESGRQWMWVAVEIAVAVAALVFIRRRGLTPSSRPGP